MRKQAQEVQEAAERLRGWLPPGTTVYTVLRHVSRSGMMRRVSLYVILDGAPQWLDGYASRVTGIPLDKKGDGLRIGGCGTDVGFEAVYNLSRALYSKGYGCIGDKCPANDHNNGDRDYTPHGHRKPVHVPNDPEALRHWHNDGGYALTQRWI